MILDPALVLHFIKMLTEDPRSPVGERRMGMSINVAVLQINC